MKDKRKNSSYYITIQNAAIFFYFVTLGSEIGKKKIGNISKIVKSKNQKILEFYHILKNVVLNLWT